MRIFVSVLMGVFPCICEVAYAGASIHRCVSMSLCVCALAYIYACKSWRELHLSLAQKSTPASPFPHSEATPSQPFPPPRTDCPTALKELEELHYTYLNADYHPDVISAWDSQDCFDDVRTRPKMFA